MKGPPEFEEPVAWQLLLVEHIEVSMGCTSAENFGVIPAQEKVLAPEPPEPGVVVSPLLLQPNIEAVEIKPMRQTEITFFIIFFKVFTVNIGIIFQSVARRPKFPEYVLYSLVLKIFF